MFPVNCRGFYSWIGWLWNDRFPLSKRKSRGQAPLISNFLALVTRAASVVGWARWVHNIQLAGLQLTDKKSSAFGAEDSREEPHLGEFPRARTAASELSCSGTRLTAYGFLTFRRSRNLPCAGTWMSMNLLGQ
jgi:hypothetical protein